MFTRNLALSVATAALLSASALPALAANPPLVFDFSTTYTSPVASPDQTLTGRWTTDNAGTITGLLYLKLNGTDVTWFNAHGTYTSTPNTTGYNPATTYAVTNLEFGVNTGGAGGMDNPTVSYQYTPLNPALWLETTINQTPVGGGSSSGTSYYQPFTMTALPEIDGGAVPKALFVVAGAFLMLFGRNKRADA